MAKKRNQLTVYPDATALAIVGGNSPACNAAIETFAAIMRHVESSIPLERVEWNYLADVLNGTIYDSHWNSAYISQEVYDAHKLNRTGWKWFLTRETPDPTPKERKQADDAVALLIRKINTLYYPQAQYILLACRHFWDHSETVDHEKHDWWTTAWWLEAAGGIVLWGEG